MKREFGDDYDHQFSSPSKKLLFSSERTYLPDDLVTEIFQRLPVKSLVRFKCVSKSCQALFRDPIFIRNHEGISSRRRKMLLLRRCLLPPKSGQDVLSFHDLDSPARELRSSIPILFLQHLIGPSPYPPVYDVPVFRFSGSIKGIVCILKNHRYILCNPALGEFKPVPPIVFDSPDQDYFPCIRADGFGLSNSSSSTNYQDNQDFKIIVMHTFLSNDDESNDMLPLVYSHVYDSRTNSWRRLDNAPVIPSMFTSGCIFLNGACHWSGVTFPHDHKTILSFDMTSEVFQLLEFPDCLLGFGIEYPRLVVVNNCLGVVQYKRWFSSSDPIEIWVMQQYGVKDSWTKQFVVGPQPFATNFLHGNNDSMFLFQKRTRRTCKARNVDGPQRENQLASVNLRTKKVKKFQVSGVSNTSCGLIYEESLVSLNFLN